MGNGQIHDENLNMNGTYNGFGENTMEQAENNHR